MNKLVNASMSMPTSSPADASTTNVLDATEFAGANYFRGADLNRRIELWITSVGIREFSKKDNSIERKMVLGTSEGRALVMGPMKIKAAMRAWGPNALAWKGERAAVFPSTTESHVE
jgi:hypothetical protein